MNAARRNLREPRRAGTLRSYLGSACVQGACLLWGLSSLMAQAPPPATTSNPAHHAVAQSRPAPPGKASTNAVVPAASAIQFENTIEQSNLKFKLQNSVSPQRYTFETMTGGVAVFDYNNDGLLDIFFTNGAAIPGLEKAIQAITTGSSATTATGPLPT